MAEPVNEVAVVRGYHAHVYYDAGSKEAAARDRNRMAEPGRSQGRHVGGACRASVADVRGFGTLEIGVIRWRLFWEVRWRLSSVSKSGGCL